MAHLRGNGAGTAMALFASSRPLQAALSIAQPLFAAFLAVGGIPELRLLALLIIGSVAGMFSVFAMNDLLDSPLDKKSMRLQKKNGWDIDSVVKQHPLGRGEVSHCQQIAWIAFTGLVAAAILYMLSPLALAFYFLAILLEAVYCRLAQVSALKALAAGLLVADGAAIGWFAAGGGWNLSMLSPLCLLFFAWEIGGRNIPNDFSDVLQDRKLGVKTAPAVYGAGFASRLILLFALLAVAGNIVLGASASLGIPYLFISTAIGAMLLVLPAIALAKNPAPGEALRYFNKASLYPVFLFLALAIPYLPIIR